MIQNMSHKQNGMLRRSANILVVAILIMTQWIGTPSGAQKQNRAQRANEPAAESDLIERAAGRICEERVMDPQGTIPIDEMALQDPLPLSDRRVIAGKERAQRLLPVVKRLLPSVLSRIGTDYQAQSISRDRIIARLGLVNTIKPDIEMRDNAIVRAREPNAIIFGTVFLAGLRSDEAMIAVLAHELTHVVDGQDHVLQVLVGRVATRTLQLSGMQIQPRPAIELTCELAGIRVMQEYLRGTSGVKNRQRLARAFEKDCVNHDLADSAHLSPRETLRLLLTLEPELTKTIAGTEQVAHPENRVRPDRR